MSKGDVLIQEFDNWLIDQYNTWYEVYFEDDDGDEDDDVMWYNRIYI